MLILKFFIFAKKKHPLSAFIIIFQQVFQLNDLIGYLFYDWHSSFFEIIRVFQLKNNNIDNNNYLKMELCLWV